MFRKPDTTATALPRQLSLRYLIGLASILALVFSHHLAALISVFGGADDEAWVNMSGRQRMLSQRIMLMSERYLVTGEADYLSELEAAVTLFDDSHAELVAEAQGDLALSEIYEPNREGGLDHDVRRFLSLVGGILDAPDITEPRLRADYLAFEELGRGRLLVDLDRAVGAFEGRAAVRAERTRLTLHAIFAVSLVVLLAEYLLIFRPMNRRLASSLVQLDREANRDPLTGLRNRKSFSETLSADLASLRDGEVLAVIAADLDGFKSVNDALGHPAGDVVLKKFATLLRSKAETVQSLRPPLISRMGGDEFFMAFVLSEDTAAEQIADFSAKVIAALADPMPVPISSGVQNCMIGTSMGSAQATQRDADIDELVSDADIALYAAKRAGKGRLIPFCPEFRRRAETRLMRENEIRRAMFEGEIRPHFQPLVDLSGGQLVGFEVLARWHHPERGVLLPDKFLPLATDLGLIDLIEGGLILRALETVSEVRNQGHTLPGLSLNMSFATLENPEFVEDLRSVAAMFEIDAETLTIEISETMLARGEDDAVLQTIRRLVEAGFPVEVDDFGTGYSSLATLADIDIVGVKLDHRLMRHLAERRAQKVVQAAVALARGMGLGVRAAGVETPEMRDFLRRVGVDVMQGHLSGKPISGEDLADWLAGWDGGLRAVAVAR